MNVLVSGAGGFVGSVLLPALNQQGFRTTVLTRAPAANEERTVVWDPSRGVLSKEALEGIDAVVHLAGESIVGRWTAAKKACIRESRIQGTRLLANTIAQLPKPPRVFVSASAIGFYGDRGEEILTEIGRAHV